MVVNLIGKAATAPFALLGAIVGGGEELAWIEFGAGSVALGTEANARLDKLAKALASRPGLKVDVTGRIDAASDAEAMHREALERALQATKRKALSGKGEAAASPASAAMAPEERGRWIAAAYAELPAAARGRDPAAKDEPTAAEMEAALAKHHRAEDAVLAELGLGRARAAKDALVTRGVDAERVFLVAPKAGEAGAKGAPRRVDFALK